VHGERRLEELRQGVGGQEFLERNQAAIRSEGGAIRDDGPTENHPAVGLAAVERAVEIGQPFIQPHRESSCSAIDEKVRVLVKDDAIGELAIVVRRAHDVVDVGQRRKYAATLSTGLPRSRGLKGVIALLSRNTTATIGTGELMGVVVGARARIATRKRSISIAVRRRSRFGALPITVSDGAVNLFQSRLARPGAGASCAATRIPNVSVTRRGRRRTAAAAA
jgi:hypothetical protein